MATESAENGAANAITIDQQIEHSDASTLINAEPHSVTENPPLSSAAALDEPVAEAAQKTDADNKWPGWPGQCVFRLIVPVVKVGSIIGRKGELIKKICDETHARIRVLDGAVGTQDRIVLISGREAPEAPLSPAMDAVIRVFKRVCGLSESEVDGKAPGASGAAFCSIRLLVATTQAINLIGKQGSLIKSIQETSDASVRVLSGDEMPFYAAPDERIVELQGEAVKVLKALEAVLGHLRKFLVDHSVLSLFEKIYNATITQDRQMETLADKSFLHASPAEIDADYTLTNRNSLFFNHETHLDTQVPSSRLSQYGQEPVSTGIRFSGIGRAGAPIVTQVAQTMQIPLTYAEDIIGIGGANIAYIRRASGAVITVQESRGLPDEIMVEIKGTQLQVQTAQKLIQECIANHQEVVPSRYGKIDAGLRSPYSQLGGSSYTSSSLPTPPYGGYRSPGIGGGYGSFRL
ncbi:K Homology domain, type 1 [Dillenia turbinata]|uniref:K Homology domain, type 1 n=1 Tax=Dillenia turbinata TaxID=194707 RepID=A0AAN8W3E8_9MAGN